jgi:hypothetical protein
VADPGDECVLSKALASPLCVDSYRNVDAGMKVRAKQASAHYTSSPGVCG